MEAWSKRISTWILNKWIKDTMVTAPTPRSGNKSIQIKYMTQVKSRPPVFAIFCNVPELPGFFETFLRTRIQHDFQLEGIPIRFNIHKSKGVAAKPSELRQGKKSVSGKAKGKMYARSVSPRKRASMYEMMKFRSRRNDSRKKQKRFKSKQKQA